MKKAEQESFLKSFGIFFTSLALLSAVLAYFEYFKLKHEMQDKIYNEMRVCSYDLQCTQYEFDFVPLKSDNLYQLIEFPLEVYALFPIPRNDTYALKLTLQHSQYNALLHKTKEQVIYYYLCGITVILIISALFSWYALYPLKHALELTEEFSRDILHDLGTPLAALRLNVSRLKVLPEDTKKIARISKSIDTIVSLGNNLRGYLEEHEYQREIFDLHTLINERLLIFQKLFLDLNFILNNKTLSVNMNKDAFIRIIDNLLSNAAKYNKQNGSISIIINPKDISISIKDSGKGITNPEKIFKRFYKEHEWGMGIGLHIVKKLCDTLSIPIYVESHIGQGSIFTLDLKKVTL